MIRYVEVKGTSSRRPVFFLSEGERQFSMVNTAKYTLLVVHAIDVRRGSYEVVRLDGGIAEDRFVMVVRQWHCEVRADWR